MTAECNIRRVLQNWMRWPVILDKIDTYDNVPRILDVLHERHLLHVHRRLSTCHHLTPCQRTRDNREVNGIGDTAQRYQDERKNGVHGSLPDEQTKLEEKRKVSGRTKQSWGSKRGRMVVVWLISHRRREGCPAKAV